MRKLLGPVLAFSMFLVVGGAFATGAATPDEAKAMAMKAADYLKSSGPEKAFPAFSAKDGPWHDRRSCWFNTYYTRVVPAHAVEMTAALLDRTVARTLARNRITTASLQQRQNLAAIIHLCGDGAGDGYARRGFRFRRGQRCGDHDPRRYLAQVNALKRQFARLAAAD